MKTKLLLMALTVALLSAPAVFSAEVSAPADDVIVGFTVQWSEASTLAVAVEDCDATAIALPAFAARTIPRFCDATGGPYSSKSCKAVATAGNKWICPKGYSPGDKNCNPLGTPCVSGGQPGQWCDCTYNCYKKHTCSAVDPEPIFN